MRKQRFIPWGEIGVWAIFSLTFLLLSIPPCGAQMAYKIVGPGDPFPDFTLENNLSPEDSAYLGVSPGGTLSLKDLKQEVILVEFLNVYCHTCREQVPIFNELLASLKKDPVLAEKVRILGIAVKGTPQEIIDFKKEFGASYPVLSDPEKKAFASIGAPPATPHSYIIAYGEGGGRFVIDYHRGGVESPQPYLREIRKALKGELTGYDLGNRLPGLEGSLKSRNLRLSDLREGYLLLYLPAATTYPGAADLRNNPNQVQELKKIMGELKEEIMAWVLPNASLSEKDIQDGLGDSAGLLLDPKRDLREAMGAKGEPLILMVNKAGKIPYRGPSVTLDVASGIVKGKALEPPRLDMSEEQVREKIKGAMLEVNPKLTSVEPAKLESGEQIYVGKFPQGEREGYLLAKVVGKITLCDVCHDTHYFYVLDQEGIIRNFTPLLITKYGNEEWDQEDVNKIKKRFVGRSLFEAFSFDPKVDAVAMATMSSSLVYEGFNEGAQVFGNLKKFDFRPEYWKNVCFDNICRIKEAVKQAKAEAKGEWEFDQDAIARFLPDKKFPLCPLEGMYVEYEGDVLCSYHGLNLRGCK